MAILGHPIHPMMVHFPVAALIGLIATDIAFITTQEDFFARAGLWLAGIGTTFGAIASLVGLIDLISVPRIRRLIAGWCHAIFAVMMLSMATYNWLLRIDDMSVNIYPFGLWMSFMTVVMITLTSFMGGLLVYEYGVGVDIGN